MKQIPETPKMIIIDYETPFIPPPEIPQDKIDRIMEYIKKLNEMVIRRERVLKALERI